MALGIFGPGTESSLAFGTMPAGTPIGSQAGVPPDRFSWSSMASQAPAADPVAPGAAAGLPFFDEADPDHVYLADFGITKHAMSRSGLTSTGQFLGTIDYVAPEQIRGASVTGQADQYSLGCVLYECLTGRVPFEKDLDAAIIWAHVEETPTMPTILRPELPPEVDEVFGRVLAKRPERALRQLPRVRRGRPRGPGYLRAWD